MTVVVRQVDATTVRALRHAVLRAGRPAEESVYPQDDSADTMHLASFDDEGRLAACGTFFPEPYQGQPAWRLRGMATAPQSRGQGYAAALLVQALEQLRDAGVGLLWCNARTSALPFYRAFGFTPVGEEFEVVGVPHYRAVLTLSAGAVANGTST